MKIEFYDIKTRSVVEMEWDDVLKGVPIGYILYSSIRQGAKWYSQSGFPLNLYWETELSNEEIENYFK